VVIDNEEAVKAQQEELHRQYCHYYTNAEQSGDVKYKGWPDLQVPFDSSSVTSGVFAANPYRPIFNPYTQISLHKNKRYLKQKKNKYKYQDKRYKFTYKQQQEREQDPVPKKLRRSVETEKQKGKRPASENENLTHQYSTPTKRSRTGPQAHSAEDHRKDSQNKKRTRTPTENQEPIQDKLFSVTTNKVITMMKIKGVSKGTG
jgi:hypothetical protein